MPMTKKERAEYAAAIERAETLAALRYELEHEAARKLLAVDRQMREATA